MSNEIVQLRGEERSSTSVTIGAPFAMTKVGDIAPLQPSSSSPSSTSPASASHPL